MEKRIDVVKLLLGGGATLIKQIMGTLYFIELYKEVTHKWSNYSLKQTESLIWISMSGWRERQQRCDQTTSVNLTHLMNVRQALKRPHMCS